MAKTHNKTSSVTDTLQALGLTENEALLYSVMLDSPRSSVKELQVRSPFPRTMLYYVLNQLIQKGMVTTHLSRGRTVYMAEDPERLYGLLMKKETEFEHEVSAIREMIPRLKNSYRLAGKRPSVRVFEGIDEYKKVMEDMTLSKPKEVLAYEVLGKRKPALDVREEHERRRIAKKVRKRILFFEDEASLRYMKNRAYDDYTQFRSIQSALTPFVAELSLYEGKLLYTHFADELDVTAVLLEDVPLYTMQKTLFEEQWKRGKDRTLAFTRSSL